MQRSETTMDEIAQVVGYTNARNLQAWWAGQQLYVPVRAESDHPLALLLDMRLLRLLVDRYAGAQIKIPTDVADERARRERLIAEMIADGVPHSDIGKRFDLSARRVQQVQEELLLRGWMRLAEGAKAARAVRRGRYALLNASA